MKLLFDLRMAIDFFCVAITIIFFLAFFYKEEHLHLVHPLKTFHALGKYLHTDRTNNIVLYTLFQIDFEFSSLFTLELSKQF